MTILTYIAHTKSDLNMLQMICFTSYKQNKEMVEYLLPLQCWFSGQGTHHQNQQGRKGPAGTLSGCETEPRCRFGPSLAPRTLQNQLHSDPVLLLMSVEASLYVAICTLWLFSTHCWPTDKDSRGRYHLCCLVLHHVGDSVQTSLLTGDTVWLPKIPERALLNTQAHSARVSAARCSTSPCLASPNKQQLSTVRCHVGMKDSSWYATVPVCVYCPCVLMWH